MKYIKSIPTGSFNPEEITREEAIKELGLEELKALEELAKDGDQNRIDLVQVNPELFIGIQH